MIRGLSEGYDQDCDIEHWRKPKESPDEEVHRWITFALAVIVAQKQCEGARDEEQPNPAGTAIDDVSTRARERCSVADERMGVNEHDAENGDSTQRV
jgi:hypothetical protein